MSFSKNKIGVVRAKKTQRCQECKGQIELQDIIISTPKGWCHAFCVWVKGSDALKKVIEKKLEEYEKVFQHTS